MVDGLETELRGRVTFLRVDMLSDEGSRLAARLGLARVPSFVAFDARGAEVFRGEGAGAAAGLARALR